MNERELLSLLLNCGVRDIDKVMEVVEVANEFDSDTLSDVIEDLQGCGIEINCNSLINELFYRIMNNVINLISDDLDIDLDEDDFEIFINFLDSHLSYIGDNKQVKHWLSDNCDLVEY